MKLDFNSLPRDIQDNLQNHLEFTLVKNQYNILRYHINLGETNVGYFIVETQPEKKTLKVLGFFPIKYTHAAQRRGIASFGLESLTKELVTEFGDTLDDYDIQIGPPISYELNRLVAQYQLKSGNLISWLLQIPRKESFSSFYHKIKKKSEGRDSNPRSSGSAGHCTLVLVSPVAADSLSRLA